MMGNGELNIPVSNEPVDWENDDARQMVDLMGLLATGRSVSGSVSKKICVVCGESVAGFRDEHSAQTYRVNGLCQVCQDKYGPGNAKDRCE